MTQATKWRFQMNGGQLVNRSSSDAVTVQPPLGHVANYIADSEDSSVNLTVEMQIAAKQRQAMGIAMAPGKNLFTTALMLWMSGSSIQIFSIMMTGMALWQPLKALATVNEPFRNLEKDEGVSLRNAKLIYISLQLLALAVGLYKCSTMGLLPLTSVDWLNYLPQVIHKEVAVLPSLL